MTVSDIHTNMYHITELLFHGFTIAVSNVPILTAFQSTFSFCEVDTDVIACCSPVTIATYHNYKAQHAAIILDLNLFN